MIAACYRRSGNYQQALQCYKMTHRKFPDNIECVKFLVNLSIDLNLPEAQEYEDKLRKLEKAKESKERKTLSSRSGRASRRSLANNRQSAESNRVDSASSNSSGYLTSSVTSRNGKRKSVLDLIEAKNEVNGINLEDLPLTSEDRPTTSWMRREDEDDFADDEIADILPE